MVPSPSAEILSGSAGDFCRFGGTTRDGKPANLNSYRDVRFRNVLEFGHGRHRSTGEFCRFAGTSRDDKRPNRIPIETFVSRTFSICGPAVFVPRADSAFSREQLAAENPIETFVSVTSRHSFRCPILPSSRVVIYDQPPCALRVSTQGFEGGSGLDHQRRAAGARRDHRPNGRGRRTPGGPPGGLYLLVLRAQVTGKQSATLTAGPP